MQPSKSKRAKRRAGIAAGALAAMLAIGGTVAYLTASDSVVNRFELDTNMQTKVVEPSWNPAAGKDVVPTQVVQKDPAIKNTGTVSQYVFASVKAPVYSGKTYDAAAGTVSEDVDRDLFTWQTNTGWTLKETSAVTDGFRTYTYVYETPLAAGEASASIFDAVTMANILEDVGIDATSITVDAAAIQSQGFESASEAYDAYKGQASDAKASVTFTLDPQDGSEATVYEGKAGDTVSFVLPSSMERTGYTFEGWYDAPEGGNKVESAPAVFPEAPVSYYAHWQANEQKIVLHAEDSDEGDVVVTGRTGEALPEDKAGQALPTPTSTFGMGFEGWYTLPADEDGNPQGDYVTTWPSTFPATDSGTTTYYALWDGVLSITYAVDFDMGDSGIGQIPSQRVKSGAFVTKPSGIVVENGYEAKFYSDAERTTEFDFEGTVITTDTTIYVGKSALPAKIVFNTNCGSEVASIEGYTGMDLGTDTELPTTTYTAFSRAAEPSYEFDAWYTENGAQEGDLVGNDEDWGHPVTSMAYFKYEMPAGETVLNARFIDVDNTSNKPFAVLTTDGTLNLYKRNETEIPAVGETYDGAVVSKVYTTSKQTADVDGIESTNLGYGNSCTAKWKEDVEQITSVCCKDLLAPKATTSMFYGCKNVTNFDLRKMDMSKCSDTNLMFANCTSLKELRGIDTWNMRNISSMVQMFSGCSSIDDLSPISGWEFNGCSMRDMFVGCKSLTSVGALSKWDVSRVNSIARMFYNCTSLREVDLRGWNVSNIKDYNGFIANCTSLERINLSGWNINLEVTSGSPFVVGSSYSVLKEVDYSNITMSPKLAASYLKAFATDHPKNLVSIDFTNWDTSELTTLERMFYGCTVLKNVKGIEDWDVSIVTSMQNMFAQCAKLEEMSLSGWNVSNCSNMTSMFSNNNSLRKINLAGWDFGKAWANSSNYGLIGLNMNSLESLNLSCAKSPIRFSLIWDKLFYSTGKPSTNNAIEMDFSCWDVTTSTTLNSWFADKSFIKSLNLEGWDVSNTTDMFAVFRNCTNLESIAGLETWNVSSVTRFLNMFSGCTSLTALNGVQNWNLAAACDVRSMFSNCSGLSVDLSSWDVPNVGINSATQGAAKFDGFTDFNKNAPGVVAPTWNI